MKKLEICKVENCIPTPASCVTWNGGSIEYLGICDGDSLTTLIWEIITKLKEIAGEDFSQFDLDTLLDICNQKAPTEVSLISILNALKQTQVCLKDYIDQLAETVNNLSKSSGVNVDLKCFADFDNLGNALSVTRESLDQLVINNLCSQKQRIETLEGKVITLQSEIDNIETNTTVDELSIATCVNPAELPTSTQVVNTSEELCSLQDATGTPGDISTSLASFPTDLPVAVTSDPNWIALPTNLAESYNNALIIISNLLSRVLTIEETCCALSCDDVELGFTAVYNEDGDGILITFSWGAGTVIPAGFEDCGSTGTITDVDGNVVSFNIVVANNSEDEVIITGLNTLSPLTVNITTRLCIDGLTCQKCLIKTVTSARCEYCTLTASGTTGSATVIYTVPDPILT